MDPHHPIFNGVTLDAAGRVDIYDQSVGSGTVSFAGVLDNGNGTLLAKAATGHRTIIAEWDAGTPFYAGGQARCGRIIGDRCHAVMSIR